MTGEPLNGREHEILKAVIRTYVETAEPTGSRTVVRRHNLGVSPATVRNTMSDLEEKGYLYHPHTSAGRVPTSLAYRLFVDALMDRPQLPSVEWGRIRQELEANGERSAVEQVVRRAVQVLGLLTHDLGVAVAPRAAETVLERLDLLPVAESKALLVLVLRSGGVKTVFVNVSTPLTAAALTGVAQVLNERLAGLTLAEIRATVAERLRDTLPADAVGGELVNLVVQSAEEWTEPTSGPEADLHLGRASVLAEQPEFRAGERLRELLGLIEERRLLSEILARRIGTGGPHITIGEEHGTPALAPYAVVTSEYRVGNLCGVIGVIGPTRMPYDRVIALVEGTSALISELLA